MVSAKALPTIRDQPLDDSETRVLEIVEEGVEGEVAKGGEAEFGLPRGFGAEVLMSEHWENLGFRSQTSLKTRGSLYHPW
jgi:hypothetical protein